MRASSQDMSFWCEISTFQLNDQVRVVTRSLSRWEVARGPSASPRLSQDVNSIAKNRRICSRRDGTYCEGIRTRRCNHNVMGAMLTAKSGTFHFFAERDMDNCLDFKERL